MIYPTTAPHLATLKQQDLLAAAACDRLARAASSDRTSVPWPRRVWDVIAAHVPPHRVTRDREIVRGPGRVGG